MEYIELISRDTNILAKFVYIICKKTISKLELEKNLEDPINPSESNDSKKFLIYELKVEFLILVDCLNMLEKIRAFPWIEAKYDLLGLCDYINKKYQPDYFLYNSNFIEILINLIHDEVSSINSINGINLTSNPFFIDHYYKSISINKIHYYRFIDETIKKLKKSVHINFINTCLVEELIFKCYRILMPILLANYKIIYSKSLIDNFDSIYVQIVRKIKNMKRTNTLLYKKID